VTGRKARRQGAHLAALLSGVMTVGAGLAGAKPPAPAVPSVAANGISGCQIVHLGPSIPSGQAPSSYFVIQSHGVRSFTEQVVVANPSPTPCRVRLLPAYGNTALNGGDSYVAVQGGCREESCWLTGLPVTVTVAPTRRQLVSFQVHVPKGTPSGDYLAGVIGEPASAPPRPRVSRVGGSEGQVGAAVVARVAIGVAVTVTGRGPLVAGMQIPGVALNTGTTPPSLNVTLHNTGNIWVHPKGQLTVTLQHGIRRVGVQSATILPGDQAVISVPVPPIRPGQHVVHLAVTYHAGSPPATWQGTIDFPAASATPAPKPGTTTLIVQTGLPRWALVIIIALGAGLVLMVLALSLVVTRRRRRSKLAVSADLVDPLLNELLHSGSGKTKHKG